MSRGDSFGDWLKQRRQTLDLTQEGLARLVECSPAVVRKWEAGERRPSKQIAELLAEKLNIPAGQRAAFISFARGAGGTDFSAQTNNAAPPPTNLPVVLPESIGREQEVDRLQKWLLSSKNRLLTLVGPGGVGKTHLALQVARGVVDQFPDGVFFVPLAAIQDPVWVIIAIGQTLGLSITQSHPKAILGQLKFFLQDQQLLLLLDNFEQVMSAAPYVAELVAVCPTLHILVTSREKLHLPGERPYSIHPLPLPDATALFVARAQAVRPNFALHAENRTAVAKLCSQLDCLPLAIELVAARIQLMSPQTLLSRLVDTSGHFDLELVADGNRNLPQRQQTLHQAISWSYTLLNTKEQMIFRRLAVFTGGFTLEAAEIVANDNELGTTPQPSSVQVWNVLASLMDKSLLEQEEQEGEIRFAMLETIREFALSRLAESGELEITRERHITYFMTLAETAEFHLIGPEQIKWLKLLEQEISNLRTALHHSLETRILRIEPGFRLASALRRFWDMHGYWLEGQRWLEAALLHRYAAPLALQARLLLEIGILSEPDRATYFLHSSLALYRELTDPWGVAQSLNWLGRVAIIENQYRQAIELCQESLALYEQAGNKSGMAEAQFNLGIIAWRQRNDEQAISFYKQSLMNAQAVGNKQLLMMVFRYLGVAAYRHGNHQQAHNHFNACLSLAQELASKNRMAAVLHHLGNLSGIKGQAGQAHEYYYQSLSLAEILGERWFVNWIRYDLEQAKLNRETREGTWFGDSLAFFQKMGDQWNAVAYLIGFAGTAKQAEQAAQLLGAASLFIESQGQVESGIQAEFDLILAATRTQLDETTFSQQWENGRILTPKQAMAVALGSYKITTSYF